MTKMMTAIAALMVAAAPLTAEAKTYKIAHFTPDNKANAVADKDFAQAVTDATNGDVTFEFFWGGSLGAGNEIIHLISDGALELGVTAPAYYSSEMPIAGLTNGTPFLFKNIASAIELQDSLSRTNQHFLDEYKRMGVFPVLQHGLTPSRLMCTRQVGTFADLAGLKVRSFGYYLPAALESLGMVPVTMALGDMYEGLQRGTIDCIAVSYSTAMAFKMHEVAKYWSDINMGASSGPVMYTTWANYKEGGWSEDFIKTVDEAAAKAMAAEPAYLENLDAEALKTVIAGGVTFTPFADQEKVDATVPDMVGLWRELQVKNGMDAAIADEIAGAVSAAIEAE